MLLEEFAPVEFPKKYRQDMMWSNGSYCKFCDVQITLNYSIKPVFHKGYSRSYATIHHIVPKSAGGRGVWSNGLVCCIMCHDEIHEFLSMFDIKPHEYFLYTTFYVWLFYPHTRSMSKIRERFSYLKYEKNLRAFQRRFRSHLRSQPALTRMLVSCYVHGGRCKDGALAHNFVSVSYDVEKIRYQLFKKDESAIDFKRLLFNHSSFFCDLLAA